MRAQPTRTMGAKRLSNRGSDKETYGTYGDPGRWRAALAVSGLTLVGISTSTISQGAGMISLKAGIAHLALRHFSVIF
jgi:hypothetical protein